MGKNRKKKKVRKSLVVMSIVLLVLLIIAVIIAKSDKEDLKDMTNGEEATESSEEVVDTEGQIFPYDAGDGIIIESVFQFSGLNPDCENQEGENIIAVTVQNMSDTYLSNAEITMTSSDGKLIHFTVMDLPAGKTTMAFSRENETSDSEMTYSDVTCEAVFDAEASMQDDKIAVSVDGAHVILQSFADEELENIDIYCHSILDDQYFGGITYTYTVDKLPAYGTAELDAVDCILGLAEVVRIVINE